MAHLNVMLYKSVVLLIICCPMQLNSKCVFCIVWCGWNTLISRINGSNVTIKPYNVRKIVCNFFSIRDEMVSYFKQEIVKYYLVYMKSIHLCTSKAKMKSTEIKYPSSISKNEYTNRFGLISKKHVISLVLRNLKVL